MSSKKSTLIALATAASLGALILNVGSASAGGWGATPSKSGRVRRHSVGRWGTEAE